MRLEVVSLLLVGLAAGLGSAEGGGVEGGVECPFPEGQSVASEGECAKYSACEWTEGQCHMRANSEAGYRVVSRVEDGGAGFKLHLQKIDPYSTLFDNDAQNLMFEVNYHEDYHVQVKISPRDEERYEVPVPLNLPESPTSTGQKYFVNTSEVGEAFWFSVKRAGSSNGMSLFSTEGPLTFEDQFIQITAALTSSYLYGFGENTHTKFRHRFSPRQTFPIFARDQPVGEGDMNEYGHHPYYVNIDPDTGEAYSVLFFNSNAMEYSTFLLADGRPALTLRSIGGIVDLHFFLGPSLEDINKQYTNMIGKPVFPPYWSLGFHLSRYGYGSTENVRVVRERMKAMGIPQDVQTCDIDYMNRYRDFTYDLDAWGDFPDLVQELHNDDVKLTLILDPALVTDWANYPPGQRGKDRDVYIKWASPEYIPGDQDTSYSDYMVGYVWPDTKTVFPDFLNPETQAWWGDELKLFHETLPFDALWIDMNEPANFGTNLDKPWNWPSGEPDWSLKCPYNKLDSPPYPTKMIRVGDSKSKRISDHTICMSGNQTNGNQTFLHYDVHSLYGWSETVATYKGLQQIFPGKRQVVLSRSTFPGSGQYAVHWLGDNSASWSHLHMSIIGMLEFNLFGVPMVGADICGFFGEPDMEMCARWMQLGAFYPFSRNHNTIDTADQDPAAWPEVAEISREYLLLRYQYLPYLYALFHRAHMHGESVVRPVFSLSPNDLTALDVDDQFLWGDGIMVAPVVTQGATGREVFFPEGEWYDLQTGVRKASGPAHSEYVEAPLERIPVYARGGVAIPYQVPAHNTVQSRKNPFGITVALNATGGASGEVFWDDGDGEHSMDEAFLASVVFAEDTLTMTVAHSTDPVHGLKLETLQFFGYPSNPAGVQVNGVDLPASEWAFNGDVLSVFLSVPLGEDLLVALG
ncbi:sucrase-isomaltase, intestinal [Penaeus vannamei]|uniref:sucrase-isomaltase, intestinal n=1 Tax=Penaeus vannamei TaxID=6689 RepID=UPI00387F6D4B